MFNSVTWFNPAVCRGRYSPGMATPTLSPGDLYWIARYRNDGYSYSKLASLFSVSRATVSTALKQLLEGRDGPYCAHSRFFDEELGTSWREGRFPSTDKDWATSKIQLCIEEMCVDLGWNLRCSVGNEGWYLFPKGESLDALREILGENFGSFGASNLEIAKTIVSAFCEFADEVEAFEELVDELGFVYKYNGWTLKWG
jgi:hypothetical protein